MDPFRSLMVEIAQDLTKENIEQLAYVFSIPKGRAEQIKSGIDFLRYLEESSLLGPNKFDEILKGLKTIKRLDLVEKICNSSRERVHGLNEDTSGVVSSVPSRVLQDFCEKEGYKVKILNGNHFQLKNTHLVELKVGNRVLVEFSNGNSEGSCVVNVCFCGANGQKQEVLGNKLNPNQSGVRIVGNFICEEDSSSSSLMGIQYIQLECLPEGATIFFQTRILEGETCGHILSEVMSIIVPKNREEKVSKVLERLRKHYPDVAGSYFYNGQKILQAEDLLPLHDHNKQNPLLLLKQKEQIHVQHSVSRDRRYIEVSPLQCNTENVKQQVRNVFKLDATFYLNVDGTEVSDSRIMDLFKGKHMEVTLPSSYRDLGVSRGSGVGRTSRAVEWDDELEDILARSDLAMDIDLPDLDLDTLSSKKFAIEQVAIPVSRSEEVLHSTETAVAVPDSKEMVTCPDDKVVITIYIVPTRS